MRFTEAEKAAIKTFASIGGRARAKTETPEQAKERMRKVLDKRWAPHRAAKAAAAAAALKVEQRA
jgi:hypothetical protein